MQPHYRVFETSRGFMGIVASSQGLRRVVLPRGSAAQVEAELLAESPQAVEDERLLSKLVDAFKRYFQGEHVAFDVKLDCAGAAPFERRVWDVCREVGYGETATYKTLAAKAGSADAARAAGSAMARNRFPVVVPCHRILRSDGGLGGYSGPGGLSFKQELLDLEAAQAPVHA
jgi:methylated-DNA-[protein]-cysteine S-methyltransferase